MSWISGSVKLEISATLPSMMRMSSSTWWIWNRKDWKHKHDKPGASQLVTSSLEKSDHFIAAVCIYHCMSMCTVVATIQNTSKHIIFPITSCSNWPFSDRWACRRSCTRKNQSGPPGHVVDWGDPGFHQPQILCDFLPKVPRGFCKAKKGSDDPKMARLNQKKCRALCTTTLFACRVQLRCYGSLPFWVLDLQIEANGQLQCPMKAMWQKRKQTFGRPEIGAWVQARESRWHNF